MRISRPFFLDSSPSQPLGASTFCSNTPIRLRSPRVLQHARPSPIPPEPQPRGPDVPPRKFSRPALQQAPASGVQDFYPPRDKNFPLPAQAKAEDDVEKEPASPAKEKKPAATVAAEKAAKLQQAPVLPLERPCLHPRQSMAAKKLELRDVKAMLVGFTDIEDAQRHDMLRGYSSRLAEDHTPREHRANCSNQACRSEQDESRFLDANIYGSRYGQRVECPDCDTVTCTTCKASVSPSDDDGHHG